MPALQDNPELRGSWATFTESSCIAEYSPTTVQSQEGLTQSISTTASLGQRHKPPQQGQDLMTSSRKGAAPPEGCYSLQGGLWPRGTGQVSRWRANHWGPICMRKADPQLAPTVSAGHPDHVRGSITFGIPANNLSKSIAGNFAGLEHR